MSLHFVLGASGSGKSRRTYQWIIREALAHPDMQYMILVPDQYTMQIQKQMVLLHPEHAIMNIDVLSFSRLYHRVMEEVGGDELTPLDDTGKNLILRKLAGSMKEELPVLGRLMDRHGYISEVKGIISELQQYGISPDGMEDLIAGSAGRRGLQARLEDVQKLYRAYVEYQQGSYRTSESMYPILTRRLREAPLFGGIVSGSGGRVSGAAGEDISLHQESRNGKTIVFLDGFTGFTPVQMPLVKEMMILAKDMYVAMTIDEEPSEVTAEQQLFYTSAKSIRDLERLAEEAGVPVAPYIWCREQLRFQASPVLAHFEKNLFRQNAGAFEGTCRESDQSNKACEPSEYSNIRLWQALNPRQESFALAGEIKRLVREEGCQYRHIAVICGDMEAYRYHLQEAFGQMEIPYFVDAGSKILHNPAMELLQGLLEMLERDFSYAGVMRYLRSGFSSLTREETDLLEVYLIETGLRGRKAFLRPFIRKGKDYSLEVINGLREKLMEELAGCLFTKEETVRVYIEQLYLFMTRLGVEQKLHYYSEQFEAMGEAGRAREYRQIYRKMMDLFNQMAVLMGDEVLSLDSFSEILRAGFEELQVGLIPAKVDQVLIGDLERSRISQVEVLFAVGVNDVNIPGNNTKGGMISDMDREYLNGLGMELAPTRRQLQFRQRFYLYQQLTKPAKRLYLSYALADNAEKELRPSYFIGTVKKLFPGLEVMQVTEEGMPEHVSELLSQSSAKLRRYAEGGLKVSEYEELYTMLFVLQKHMGAEVINGFVEQAFFTGGQELLDSALARSLYGSVLYGSISRLEQYAACPYGHFLKYGLGIKEPQEYILESADLGNIFHDVLDGFGKDLEQDGYTWKDFPEEYGDLKISQRLAYIREQYGDELLLDKARNGYALSRADRILKRSIRVLKKHMQAGAFSTYGLEIHFDVSCEWNATRELMMKLKGRIDRLDVATVDDDIYVKVIDYKSGNKQLELDCIYAGLQMQLLVYLDTAAKMLEERYPAGKVHPAAMFYYRVADPVVSMEGAENLDELSEALLKEQRSRGLLNSDETVVHLLDSEMELSSNVIPLNLRKDGTPGRGSGVCTEEQFGVMRRFIHHKLYEMGSEIMSGHIEKAPYVRSRQEEGCTYCPYKGVCGFDEKQFGYEKRRIETLSDEAVWEKMQGDINGGNIYRRPAKGH